MKDKKTHLLCEVSNFWFGSITEIENSEIMDMFLSFNFW